MRPPVDAERIREFAHRLGRVASVRTRIYLTGGATFAGRTRCYFVVDDLDEATLNFVAAMCMCRREVDEGRLEGPFNSDLAAKWARLVMIGPHDFAGRASTDEELAVRLRVPLEQVVIARREFRHLSPALS
jgi:hypothetical protein